VYESVARIEAKIRDTEEGRRARIIHERRHRGFFFLACDLVQRCVEGFILIQICRREATFLFGKWDVIWLHVRFWLFNLCTVFLS
jgi:hypothetical protein